ncbi:MAG TPA: HAMP domain-containing sensor histidine kinase [Steroidobacteraceae bacterium]
MKRATDKLIALQFLAVVLPIAVVLLVQMAADARRAARLEHSRPLRILASEARANYKTFTNGAADAVDTGTLGAQSVKALQTAAARLTELADHGEAAVVGDAESVVKDLAATLPKGATLSTLISLRSRIIESDTLTKAVDDEFERRDEFVVKDAIASAVYQKRAVTGALIITAILTVLFVLATRRRLKARLEADISAERERSRQAGMAEIATNVLHNVGNVLNSVNISASIVTDRVRKPRSAGLGKVAALLQEQAADLVGFVANDERAKHLPVYLAQLAEHLARDQEVTLKELDLLRKNIDHIKEIVSMQQSYSKLVGVPERLAVANLVDDALRMNAGSFTRHGVNLKCEFEDVPEIVVEKHKVLQILVNLLRNARYACEASGKPDKEVVMRIAKQAAGVQIAVIDNGIGIQPDHMTRIFSHGFTTKKDGHGFGLHSGALAARDLGGALHVHSAGAGQGATFTLDLPFKSPEAIYD